MYFDRFDICEAYYLYSVLWGAHDRMTARIQGAIRRMRFSPGASCSLETANENVKAIYGAIVRRENGLYIGYERLARRGHVPPWPGTAHIRGTTWEYLSKAGVLAAVLAACP